MSGAWKYEAKRLRLLPGWPRNRRNHPPSPTRSTLGNNSGIWYFFAWCLWEYFPGRAQFAAWSPNWWWIYAGPVAVVTGWMTGQWSLSDSQKTSRPWRWWCKAIFWPGAKHCLTWRISDFHWDPEQGWGRYCREHPFPFGECRSLLHPFCRRLP